MSAAASSAALAQAAASGSVTAGLLAWSAGDAAALDALVPGVYAELRRQARRALRRESDRHTLQPTALVHEAYLRLLDQERGQWRNRAQFFGIAAQLMRRILVDHARARHAAKRGGGARQRTLGAVDVAAAAAEEAGTDVLALHEPLTRLAALDRRGGAAGGATLLRWPHDRGDRRRVGRLASDDEAAVDRRPRLAPVRVGHGGRESGACMTRPPRGALTPERWQQVKTMLQAAQERAHVERAALLGAACAADPALRGEVASLLAAVDGAMPILDPPAVALRRPRAALLRGGGERDLEDVEDAADADDETAEAAATAARIWATLEAALVGRYTLERELGRGGTATVYLARDVRHGRAVALKVLDPALAAAMGPSRFRREVEAPARLSHPHILPRFDSGEAAGLRYYVMPHVEGASLRDRLEDAAGPLPLAETLRIMREVVDALAYAHRHGVVHRDVKF